MSDIKTSIKICLILLSGTLAYSCSVSNYKLVRANRSAYQMNQNAEVDSTIIKTYTPYKTKLEEEMNQVIGHADVLMSKVDTVPENLLRNFFSDACLAQALKIDPEIDLAMPSTKGGIRIDVPKGPIRLTNIFELMPFENELIVYKLKGSDVQNLLEFIADSGGQPIAGFSMKIKEGRPVDVIIKGKPFDPGRSYWVLTSDYIAGGGDRVESFKNPLEKKMLNLRVRAALIGYVKENEAAGKSIKPILDGRITNN